MPVLQQSSQPLQRKRIGAFGMLMPVKRRPPPIDQEQESSTQTPMMSCAWERDTGVEDEDASQEADTQGNAGLENENALQLEREEIADEGGWFSDTQENAGLENADLENEEALQLENEEIADEGGWFPDTQENADLENGGALQLEGEENADEGGWLQGAQETDVEVETAAAAEVTAAVEQKDAVPDSPSSSSSGSSSRESSPACEITDESSLLELAGATSATRRNSDDEMSLLDLASQTLKKGTPFKAPEPVVPVASEQKNVPLPQTPPRQMHKKSKKVATSATVRAVYTPLHRRLPAPERSSLKDSTSWDQGTWDWPLVFKEASELVSIIEVTSHRQDDLWFAHAGVRVSCEWCESACLQGCGQMQGDPGRSAFAQSEFVCQECMDQWDEE